MANICIDFDGTVVTHRYPDLGFDIGALPTLRQLVDSGHNLILFTMRSGEYLDDAVKWFTSNNIPLYGINNNPEQHKWTDSPKAYAELYIDDAALGAPLIYPINNDRPYIDWRRVNTYLIEKKYIVVD